MEIQDVDKILEVHKVSAEEFERIRRTPRFLQYLDGAIQEWNSALNTHERVKIKAAYLLEEWLAELNARLHDKAESLAAKIEGGKFAARLAGMGLAGANVEGAAGEHISVTINLGNDRLLFEKTATQKTIEG